MKYTMYVSSVLSLLILNACGSKGSSSSLSSAKVAASIQGSWTLMGNSCTVLSYSSGSHTLNSTSTVYTFDSTTVSMTATYYSDTACATPAAVYKMSSSYALVNGTADGNGALINTAARSTSTVKPLSSAAATEINGLNTSNASCSTTFANGVEASVIGQECRLENSNSTGVFDRTDSNTSASYDTIKVDTTVSPIKLYLSQSDSTNDGTTDAKRTVEFDTSFYFTKN